MHLNTFVRHLRDQPEYNSLMEWKHREHPNLNSKQFVCMLYVHDLIDNKVPVKDIRTLIPAEHVWILTDIMKARLHPRRLYVNWTMAQVALKQCSGHDPTFDAHQRLYYPFAY